MKICVIGNPNSPHTVRWIHGFKGRHEITLLADRHPSTLFDKSVQCYDLSPSRPIPKIRYLEMALKLKNLLRKIQPDLLIAHGVASAGWLGALSGFHPFLLTAHGSDLMLLEKRSLLHQLSTRISVRTADYLTCVSDTLTEKSLKLGVPQNRVQTIYLGIDTNTFAPGNREIARAKSGLIGRPIIFHLRPLRSIYNPLVIARAIPEVLKSFPDAQFIIPTFNAEPEIKSAFEKNLASQNASGAVHWLPPLHDDAEIAGYLVASDAAVSVASSDGTPKSVQEAMACEIPTIAGDIPALRAWIRPGETGVLVPLNDHMALSHAIVSVLQSPGAGQMLGKSARQDIIERADVRKTTMQYEALFLALTQNKPGYSTIR